MEVWPDHTGHHVAQIEPGARVLRGDSETGAVALGLLAGLLPSA